MLLVKYQKSFFYLAGLFYIWDVIKKEYHAKKELSTEQELKTEVPGGSGAVPRSCFSRSSNSPISGQAHHHYGDDHRRHLNFNLLYYYGKKNQ
jgi:hypothetical protein